MKHLPLYPPVPLTAVEQAQPRALEPTCTRCKLGAASIAHRRCIAADGEPGGLLVIGDAPTKDEALALRPMVGRAGAWLRKQIEARWSGPVVYDAPVRCAPGSTEVTETEVEACRGYMAAVLQEARPSRVLLLGTLAQQVVLGRQVQPLWVRRGYAWLASEVPAYMLMSPRQALSNRFLTRWLLEDLDWALQQTPPVAPQWDATAVVVTRNNLQAAIADLRSAAWVAYDTETTGERHNDAYDVVSVAVVGRARHTVWVWDRASLRDRVCLTGLVQLMADATVPKVGQNIKFDNLAMEAAFGVQVQGTHLDTRLVRKMLENDASAALETLAELVGMGGHKEEMQTALVDAKKHLRKAIKSGDPRTLASSGNRPDVCQAVIERVPQGVELDAYAYGFVPDTILTRYNALDTLSTARVAELLEERLQADRTTHNLWRTHVLPASEAVTRMEANGIAADVDAIKAFSTVLYMHQMEVQARLRHYGDLNWNSPVQVRDLLYTKLGLKPDPYFTTDTGYSTSEAALESLRGQHPIVDDILLNRKLQKLQGTYAQGLLLHVRGDGRIHASFNLDGAGTGRLSSSDPNMQNTPNPGKDGDGPPYGKMARDCFVAPPGRVLLQFDYSQLELRVAAALSGDPEMRAVFESGVDYHLKTAQDIAHIAWGIPADAVTKQHRGYAKAVNFGLLYGKGDGALARDLGCTLDEAVTIRAAILGKFRKLKEWIDRSRAFALNNGYCTTWWKGQPARRRSLYRIADPDKGISSNAERSSWNTPIQGTGADFCTASLYSIDAWIEHDCVPALLVNSVHDSIILEVEESAADEVAWQVPRLMTSWPCNGVPLVVDTEVGRAWGSMVKLEPGQSVRQALI